jgi:threonylcarbamoyladenosine tRNA methylthiotransferase MtaB
MNDDHSTNTLVVPNATASATGSVLNSATGSATGSARDSATGKAPAGRRISLHTLGCRLNQAETAVLAASLQLRGYKIVPYGEAAELVVLNSCSVTAEAENECRRQVRSIMRRNPATLITVTGCYAQVGVKTLRQLPGVDLIVGTEDKQRIPELLDQETTKRQTTHVVRNRPGKDNFVQANAGLYLGQTRANLKIQDGCDVGCSFCIIPQTRGRARSRQFADVLREATALLDQGHRELVITGVNLGSYADGSQGFVDLLQALQTLPNLRRLRISSIEPSTVTTQLLEFMAAHPRICRHLHIPVQSGCTETLQRMRRPTTRADLDDVLAETRRILPEVTLGTDVMVGFPGEDETSFARTQEFMTNAGFSYLHVFSYSPRPGTRATRLEAEVPRQVIRQRSRKLHEIDQRLRQQWQQRILGQEVEVLLEERKPEGQWVGLTDQFHRVAVPDAPGYAANTLVRLRIHQRSEPGARALSGEAC